MQREKLLQDSFVSSTPDTASVLSSKHLFQTTVVTTTDPPRPTPPKRQNPLFVGPVEEDIPLDDPYFNHNGNVSSFMETYTALHNNLTSSNSKRVVVYFPMKETGLGNCLLALSSSFFYAVLTKRAFLLNYAQFTRHFIFSFKVQNSTYTCIFSCQLLCYSL